MRLIFEDVRSMDINERSKFIVSNWWCEELGKWFSTLVIDNVLLIKTNIYNCGLLKKIAREIEERYIAGDLSYDTFDKE